MAHNMDEQMRGQFLVREERLIHLNWLDHLDKSSNSALTTEALAVGQAVNRVVFSPLGSYLAVCCVDGVHIYVGGLLRYKCLLRQVNPVDVKFSPDEKWLVSSNGGLSKNRENFILWALEEEIKIKALRAHANQTLEFFQFSEDGRHLAIIGQNEVGFFKLDSV